MQPGPEWRQERRVERSPVLCARDARTHVVVKLDADTSIDPDHFERLTRAFAAEPPWASRAVLASSSTTEDVGSQPRLPSATPAAPRGHIDGNASNSCSRSWSESAGTASTGGKPPSMAGPPRCSRTSASTTIGASEPATVHPPLAGRHRASSHGSSATGFRTFFFERSTVPGRTERPWLCSAAISPPPCAVKLGYSDGEVRADVRHRQTLRALAGRYIESRRVQAA